MTSYSMSYPPRPRADPALTPRSPTRGQWPLATTPTRGARRRASVRSGVSPRSLRSRRRSLRWWSQSGACPPPCRWSSASSSAPSPPWSSSSSSSSRFGQEWMYRKWSRYVITSEWRLHQLLMKKNSLIYNYFNQTKRENHGFCLPVPVIHPYIILCTFFVLLFVSSLMGPYSRQGSSIQ